MDEQKLKRCLQAAIEAVVRKMHVASPTSVEYQSVDRDLDAAVSEMASLIEDEVEATQQ